ncbi:hypothetical protein BB558_002071 [Smittium angustum]|uniref:Uncharacterized protein n=1 Tax=Smittium angustum TaxID=133377 RepID=A0A2U1J9U8_SMIAN|nr:hypothetical protein BB558_002071 [Smittium angustum]
MLRFRSSTPEDINFIFIDKVGFSVSSRTKKGRALVGTSVYLPATTIKSKNITVIAAASKYEILTTLSIMIQQMEKTLRSI